MQNPILSALTNNQNNSLGRIKDLMGMVRNANNPQDMISQMASKNPQLKTVMDMAKGGNPKDLFYDVCQQRGINPDDILSQMK